MARQDENKETYQRIPPQSLVRYMTREEISQGNTQQQSLGAAGVATAPSSYIAPNEAAQGNEQQQSLGTEGFTNSSPKSIYTGSAYTANTYGNPYSTSTHADTFADKTGRNQEKGREPGQTI